MEIEKQQLFARLAEGHAARITVVTPNKRLSQALMSEFDAFQIAKGLTVWEAPDILPFDAFVERLWEDALYSDLGDKLPLLLTPAQEDLLWQQIISGADILFSQPAAAQCREAWRLVHEWRVGPARGNEDAAAFSSWSKEYQRRTKGDIDAACLPDLMAGHLSKIKIPKLLVAYAFDILPPQTREFLEKFELLYCHPEKTAASALRTSFNSAREELESAAKWARARLEAGRARIGVVIPNLEKRRKEAVRMFSRIMQPGCNLPGAAKAPMPFNVSLGLPLDQYPLVALALSVLQFTDEQIPFEKASRLIRSPFLAGAESEIARRAALDARLRRNLDATVSLPKLIGSIEHCPILRSALEKLFTQVKEFSPAGKSPSDWARRFSALLEAAGFPGERALDSDEFQTLAKWHEALGEFAKLDRVSSDWSFSQAIQILKKISADTLFQPESADAPIQVLGIFEATGLRFDCLWVSGLTDEAWPLAARPNPFIPVAAQKKAGIPQASAEGSLALDRRFTEEWLGAAAEVVFSFPRKEKDRDFAPSPLILGVAEAPLAVPEYPRYRDLLFESRKFETFEDAKAPPVTVKQVRGGTRVLADQAACPFRAFARWRLAAEALEEPAAGLDARDRGKLLHTLMSVLWQELKSSSALEKDLDPAIARAAEAAIKDLGIEGRLAELERTRLAKVAREWLELEKQRPPFKVLLTEERRTLAVAGIEFDSRLDRMDRLDRGGHVLVDYKTGAGPLTPKQWEGPRPDDPQLPLYACAAREELAAVAFARVRPGAMRFIGLSRELNLLPGVNEVRSWKNLLAEWKKDAEALGAAFAAGEARVDPKYELKTCQRCDLQTLCRVYEKINALDEGAKDDA